MELAPYHSILREPLAFWVANSNSDNIPELVRCAGLAPVINIAEITLFISEVYGKRFMENITSNPSITLSATSVYTYESYQYKGVFQSIRTCSKEEEEMQRQYLDAFTDIMADIGYSKQGFFQSFFHQPSFAVTFQVQEIFEQTPHKSTGKRVIKVEKINE